MATGSLRTTTLAKGKPPTTIGSRKCSSVQHSIGLLMIVLTSAMGPSWRESGVGRGGRNPGNSKFIVDPSPRSFAHENASSCREAQRRPRLNVLGRLRYLAQFLG